MWFSAEYLPGGIPENIAAFHASDASRVTAAAGASGQFGLVGMSSPFRYVFMAFILVIVGQFWLSRSAPFRAAARRGGWRLVIAVVATPCMLVFGYSIATGQLIIGLVAMAGFLPTPLLFLDGLLAASKSRQPK